MTTPRSSTVKTDEAQATPTTPKPTSRVPSPPSDACIPPVPPGFVPTLGHEFFGVPPRTTHMAALPQTLQELQRATDFAEVFGKTAPPLEYTLDIVQAAFAWSQQRAQMRAWDQYCRAQEGLAWRELRVVLRRLAKAFDCATEGDSTIASRYGGLGSLLAGQRESARKAARTRRAKGKVATGQEESEAKAKTD